MNVLVVGSGAREHALAWKLRQSPRLTDLFVAPGNAGTQGLAVNLPVPAMDFDGLYRAVQEHRISLVVVGPEDPLAAGLVDFLTERGVPAYGPSAAAAQIEASKAFAKQIMAQGHVPTAAAAVFTTATEALAYLDQEEDRGRTPPVVKANGLAAGKGVTVAADYDEARTAVRTALEAQAFGAAGATLLLEERMSGREVSAHAFCDGATAVPMVYSRDYKRVFDGDQGPNTGGMGVVSPPPYMTDALAETALRTVIEPTLRALAVAGAPYRGTLYPGLMLTNAGPKVVEFNCRFGDPETQALMPRLESDLLEVCLAVVEGRLKDVEVRWSERPAVGVVLASGGYPGAYATGLPITGLDDIDADVQVFHAGTRRRDDGVLITAGGRVLTVVATGATPAQARDRVYANAARIHFDGCHYRHDIGE